MTSEPHPIAIEALILESTRWRADMVIENYEGQRVWLKRMPGILSMPGGYITDCCLEDEPCDHHAALAAVGVPADQEAQK